MSKILTIMAGLSICLTMNACGSKSDSQKAVDDANKSIEKTKKDMDKTAEDAKKAGEKAQDDTAQKANESTLDITSAGGQPGSISLAGALVMSESNLDPRVTVKLTSGKSWKGVRPEVKAGTLSLKAKQADATIDEIQKLNDDKSFVNLGCEIADRIDLKDLQEKQLDPADTSTVMVINANTVLICGQNQIKKSLTLITAKTVILSNVQQELVGAVDKTLSITAQDLNLYGESKISSKGKDSSSTILQGPSVSVSAEKISGNGKLEITAEGSNYLGESK
jgi:hypothetical protein